MTYQIRKAAVLGAGVMGAGIAAHLANIGIPSLLLDIVPTGEVKDRNIVARMGLDKTLKAKPAVFYSKRGAQLITLGNIEDDLAKLADVDWIVEAVVERPDVKQNLYDKIETVLGGHGGTPLAVTPYPIISSNTSGLPAHLLVEGRSEQFRRHFLITHFFNPVRYMRLLEIVPNADTDPDILAFMERFGSEVLGKGVVRCKDTPNFIANRIGTYGALTTIRRAIDEGYSVGEVDTILGPNMGRPKSAVFRTADLSGLDTLKHVAENLYENAPRDEQREAYRTPGVMDEIISRGWLGEKSGRGFYKRIKNPGGESVILELNLKTLEYEPSQKVRFESIGTARKLDDSVQRLLAILNGHDRASTLARETTADSIIYTANLAQEIADSIVAVDNALKWGFNFEMGSFELWDLLLENPETLSRVLAGRELPALVRRVQEKGQGTFYIRQKGQKKFFDFNTDSYQPVPMPEGSISLKNLIASRREEGAGPLPVVHGNGSASLIDLGDGIACLEFHTKMNTIDEGIFEMMRYAVEEGSKQFRALVIGNEAADFSAGANVFLILMGARQGAWEMIGGVMNSLQQAHQLLKYSPIPVVAAAAGRALGGGCEVVLHCNHTRALAESYLGLVEVGVGLIPAGGGCKELLLRHGASADRAAKSGGPFNAVRPAFEIIASATVSTSAVEAQELRFLRKMDAITLNRDLLLRDAKADAIKLAEAQAAGQWQPPQPQMLLLPGAGARLVLEQQVQSMLLTGQISEHDAVIGNHLAHILTGGNCSPATPLTEQYVLDLEREAFLSLCGMDKTQERMQAILMGGKPLRN